MKSLINSIVVFFVAFAMLGACATISPQVGGELFYANALEQRYGNVNVIITEVERKEKTSIVDVNFISGNSVASSVFIACSFSKLAKTRGYRYTVQIEKFGKDDRFLIGFIPTQTKEAIMQLGTEFAKHDVSQITDNKIYEPIC